MKEYDHLSEEEQINIIREDPDNIREISNPSKDLIDYVLDCDPHSIRWLNNPSEDITLYILGKSPESLQYMEIPFETQKKIVGLDPYNIRNIIKQSNESKWIVIKADLEVIIYIKSPTQEMLMYAINNIDSLKSLLWMKNYYYYVFHGDAGNHLKDKIAVLEVMGS